MCAWKIPYLCPGNHFPFSGLATLPKRWARQTIEHSSERSLSVRRENRFRKVRGDLRFPLTFTYHGCAASPPGAPVLQCSQLRAFSQYYELYDGCYEQLSLTESCANFCGFGLHLCEKSFSAAPKEIREATGSFVVFFRGKPQLAIFFRTR